MDKKRDPAILKRKKIRRGILGAAAIVGVIAISVAVSRLEPAAPSVDEGTLWFGTVTRGDLRREVRGAGNLVPEEIRWISPTTTGRVEQILLRPGAQVDVGTPILELSNLELESQMDAAAMDWETAKAQLSNQKATLTTQRLQLELAATDAKSDYALAVSDLEANKELFDLGLVAESMIRQLEANVQRQRNRMELTERQLTAFSETEQSQLAPLEATVNQAKARFDQLARQVSELTVRSNMRGQLQEVNVEVGQQMGPGAQFVRVSDPTRLKAEIRISETQTRDLAIGLPAMVDTRTGAPVRGHVSRIDPASQGGTVGVDVILDEPLPANARVSMSVDGTIQLQLLKDVLYVESPAFGAEDSTISLFRVDPETMMAHRVPVRIGVRSVQYVQVLEGLSEGDRVVLTDVAQYDQFDRIQIR